MAHGCYHCITAASVPGSKSLAFLFMSASRCAARVHSSSRAKEDCRRVAWNPTNTARDITLQRSALREILKPRQSRSCAKHLLEKNDLSSAWSWWPRLPRSPVVRIVSKRCHGLNKRYTALGGTKNMSSMRGMARCIGTSAKMRDDMH